MEKDDLMVTVIVPVYNAEKYLQKCIESILGQTHKNLELILVDDGSKDSSGSICDQMAVNDSRIKVLHQKNAGVSAARNAGVEAAGGDFITFVDSDDYIESTMYEEMLKKAVEYDCDVVMCDCIKEFEDHQSIYTHDIRPGFYNRDQLEKEYFKNLLIMPNVEYPPTISNVLCLYRMRKKSNDSGKDFVYNGYYKNELRYVEGVRFSEDLLFGAEMIFHADSFYYMKNQYFYHYVIHPQSASHTFVNNKWIDYVKLHDSIEAKFVNYEFYDFQNQIDLVLLFFVYNSVGEILRSDQLSVNEKLNLSKQILRSDKVRDMFSRISVLKLPVSNKLKAVTAIYKYSIGIKQLINWWN